MKQIDVKLEDFQTVKKLASFFRKLFIELLVVQKIKRSKSAKLLKYHGFSIRINRFFCLEVSLFSDLMEMDLQQYLQINQNRLSVSEKLTIALRIAEGIEELQRLLIIHSDIKPQNILLDKDGNFYIADYGTCMIMKFDHTLVTGTINATLRFAPPELLTHHLLTFKVYSV